MAKNPSGFAAEFAKQRAALGAGKTFTYQGKSYSTNRADDKPGMTSSPRPKAKPAPAAPKAAPMPARAAGLATPAAPKMRPTAPAVKTSPIPKARPAAPAPMTSARPMARSAEFVAANGGARKANANRKYSPTEEMRLRNMKDK